MSETPFLFVYGTLMSAASDELGRPMRERLQREARSLGAAAIHGRLYDLGDYPGLRDGTGNGEVVHGEVFRLDDPEAVFLWLDAYESIVPNDPAASEYERARRSVTLADGTTVTASVYLYRTQPAQEGYRPDGRWLAARV